MRVYKVSMTHEPILTHIISMCCHCASCDDDAHCITQTAAIAHHVCGVVIVRVVTRRAVVVVFVVIVVVVDVDGEVVVVVNVIVVVCIVSECVSRHRDDTCVMLAS